MRSIYVLSWLVRPKLLFIRKSGNCRVEEDVAGDKVTNHSKVQVTVHAYRVNSELKTKRWWCRRRRGRDHVEHNQTPLHPYELTPQHDDTPQLHNNL